jgi:hypothetical protein
MRKFADFSDDWKFLISHRVNHAKRKLARGEKVRLSLDTDAFNRRLKHGATEATLKSVKGDLFHLQIDGYKNPTTYHADFWKVKR